MERVLSFMAIEAFGLMDFLPILGFAISSSSRVLWRSLGSSTSMRERARDELRHQTGSYNVLVSNIVVRKQRQLGQRSPNFLIPANFKV
ncbi:unnamed protein product [Dovyalis caffra]|uniref:Uncharacterized protein n=1 Tax=Dovyalis caffra TaxID=77055 RepID=A0AAV1QY47_9ROSI|nr:unnamed protein product [Dovyalis caffra]